VTDPGEDYVSVADALAETCPTCAAVPGALCIYTADATRWSQPDRCYILEHLRGEVLKAKVHGERRALVRTKRWRARRNAWLRANRGAAQRRSAAVEAFRAMRAWDMAEQAALTAWWREHGHIIADAACPRPDGTARGMSYARLDDERVT
jgi:hypothetical protein